MLLAWMLATTPVAASGPDAHLADVLRVRPGATCVEAGLLAQQVTAWLGGDGVEHGSRVEVEGGPTPQLVGFRLIQGGEVVAERRFDPAPARCDHLHAALGLAIALALKAQLLDEIGTRPAFSVTPRRALSLAAEARAAWNVLPGAALGGGARVEYPLGRGFHVQAGLFGLAAWPKALGDSGGEFTSSLVALAVDGCVTLFDVSTFEGRACAGFAGGALRTSGSGFDVPRADTLPWFAVSQSVRASARLTGHWSLLASAALVLPLQATQFAVRTSLGAPISERDPDPVGLTGALGARYAF